LKPDLLIIQAVQPPRFDLALLSAMWPLGLIACNHGMQTVLPEL
jgi:hypothetical protein